VRFSTTCALAAHCKYTVTTVSLSDEKNRRTLWQSWSVDDVALRRVCNCANSFRLLNIFTCFAVLI